MLNQPDSLILKNFFLMEPKDTFFSKKQTLNINGRLISPNFPVVMGIVNITPDSFYEGSRATTLSGVLKRCEQIIKEGAEIIDIGAYSSRPDAEDITIEEEKKTSCRDAGRCEKRIS